MIGDEAFKRTILQLLVSHDHVCTVVAALTVMPSELNDDLHQEDFQFTSRDV